MTAPGLDVAIAVAISSTHIDVVSSPDRHTILTHGEGIDFLVRIVVHRPRLDPSQPQSHAFIVEPVATLTTPAPPPPPPRPSELLFVIHGASPPEPLTTTVAAEPRYVVAPTPPRLPVLLLEEPPAAAVLPVALPLAPALEAFESAPPAAAPPCARTAEVPKNVGNAGDTSKTPPPLPPEEPP